MNRLTIIGNLTRDPEMRAVNTANGQVSVCDFSVAVNRRNRAEGQPEADFFRVTAWRGLAENCHKFLAKGRKVAVVGEVSVRTYTGSDGTTRASLEVTANDVEFLSPRGEGTQDSGAGNGGYAPAQNAGGHSQPTRQAQQTDMTQAAYGSGYVEVEDDDLPF